MKNITPYKMPLSKKEQVSLMFNKIAFRYDLLNRLLSAGIDKYWRKKTIKGLKPVKDGLILDVATGTADLAIESLKLKPSNVTGIDLSTEMLKIGEKKISEKKLSGRIQLFQGDSERLPFRDRSFDIVTVGFGVRNFENLETGLNEIFRVLKENGQLAILEFSSPERFPFKQLYSFYFNSILPLIGRIISKDRQAYSYLPESVMNFPNGKKFATMLEGTGFVNIRTVPLSMGIATIYYGTKL